MVAEEALAGIPAHLASAAQRQQQEAAAAMREEAEAKQAATMRDSLGLADPGMEFEGDPADLAEFERMASGNVRRFQGRTSQAREDGPLVSEYDRAPAGGSSGPERLGVDYEETHLGLPQFVTARFRLPDGSVEEMELDVPEMTMERIEMFSWWQHQVALKHAALLQVGPNNERGLAQAQLNSRRAKERFICYAVPTFPAPRFPQLLAESFLDIVSKLDERRHEATGEAEAPQTRSGRPNR